MDIKLNKKGEELYFFLNEKTIEEFFKKADEYLIEKIKENIEEYKRIMSEQLAKSEECIQYQKELYTGHTMKYPRSNIWERVYDNDRVDKRQR